MTVGLAIPLVTVIGQWYGNPFNVVGLQHWNLAIVGVATAASVLANLALVGTHELTGVAAGNVVSISVMSLATVAAGGVARRRAWHPSAR